MSGSIRHELSFAVRFNDHFMQRPVRDALPVRLGASFQRPALNPAGSARQEDGTYRFVDVRAGTHEVLWLPSFERSFRGWTSWQTPISVELPRAAPTTVVEVDLWPTAEAVVSPGTTAIRGKIVGPTGSDREIVIQRTGAPPTDRGTRTNAAGEFLFVLPGQLELNAAGLVPLTVSVSNAVVASGEFVPASAGTPFVGSSLVVRAGVVTRVRFFLS